MAESVWDYPRPPRLETCSRRLTVEHDGIVVADTNRGFRILETSHPPVYYIPPEDVLQDFFSETDLKTFCEWKGVASYCDVRIGDTTLKNAAWFYKAIAENYRPIQGYFAFYPSSFDRCAVNGETVESQPGDFYGGWITSDIKGPFKGPQGTMHW